MLVLADFLPLTSPSSVLAKRDNKLASSVSEQLQSRNADGGNWNGVEEFVPERANVYLTEKNNREIQGGEDFILEGHFGNGRGRDKSYLKLFLVMDLAF